MDRAVRGRFRKLESSLIPNEKRPPETQMRFAYHATMCAPEFYLPLVIAAEEAGFDSFTLPDSICYPEESDSQYPYNGTGDREFLDGVPFLEPFSLIPAMGAVTASRTSSEQLSRKTATARRLCTLPQCEAIRAASSMRWIFSGSTGLWGSRKRIERRFPMTRLSSISDSPLDSVGSEVFRPSGILVGPGSFGTIPSFTPIRRQSHPGHELI